MSTTSAVPETSSSVPTHAADANTTTATTVSATSAATETATTTSTPGMFIILLRNLNRFPRACYWIAENHLDGIGISTASGS